MAEEGTNENGHAFERMGWVQFDNGKILGFKLTPLSEKKNKKRQDKFLETIKGKVTHIVFENKDNGFKVLKIKIPKGPTLTITGEFGPEIIEGTAADFHGDYKPHPKYGVGFKVTSYAITHNQEQINSLQLFMDSAAFNIGPERARALIKHFGDDLVRVLDEEPQRLEEVEGIGRVSAESIKETWLNKRQEWFDNRQIYSLRAFLNNLGIKERRVKKILARFGGLNSEDKIRENPYILTEIDGFGFSTADYIAKQLGVPDSDPLRLKAFLYYMLKVLCPNNGHLFMSQDDMVMAIKKYCQETITRFIGKDEIIKEDLIGPLRALKEDKLIMEDGNALYAKPCYNYEAESANILSNIMSTPSDLILLNRGDVERHIELFEKENSILLSKEQKDALYLFAEQKVFILTGGPGTGKTRTLQALVGLIQKLRLNLTCMTPTGISAKKMAETINYDAYTIHRRLGYRGSMWTYNEGNKFETDVVILDEVSMVDQETFYRLLLALKNRVHVILVGDDNQLPSVGAGNVLRELINCKQVPTIRLEQIFRQNEASDIIKAAHQIKNGDTSLELFKPYPKADVFFIREKNIAKIEDFLVKLAQKFKDEKRHAFQIISPRNQGPLSVDSLNALLQSVLNPESALLPELKCMNFILRKGDRIRVKKNDYENGIYNGDLGKVTFIGGGYVEISVDDRSIKLAVDEVDEKLKLAYAITAHGMQGNECAYIILPFINQYGKMLLQRNLLYTAITRAKEKVIVIGHRSALEKAINNASVYRRNTKLGERLCCQLKKRNFMPMLPGEPVTCQAVQENVVPPLLEVKTSSAVGITDY